MGTNYVRKYSWTSLKITFPGGEAPSAYETTIIIRTVVGCEARRFRSSLNFKTIITPPHPQINTTHLLYTRQSIEDKTYATKDKSRLSAGCMINAVRKTAYSRVDLIRARSLDFYLSNYSVRGEIGAIQYNVQF